jgi:hypothetical protein
MIAVVVVAVVGCKEDGPVGRSRPPSEPSRNVPVAPTSSEPTRSQPDRAESPPVADVARSVCLKAAENLVTQARHCGIDMGDRTPEAICTELLQQERFTDEQAVSRLAVFTSGGCKTLRVAREGDRI